MRFLEKALGNRRRQGGEHQDSLATIAAQLGLLNWGPEASGSSLQQVFGYVQAVGAQNSSWYRRKKRSRRALSVVLHFVSLSLLLVGGLCPLIPASLLSFNPQSYGYLLLAAGGGLLLFDRLFGISSSWMRFMVAAQQIESALATFRMDWLKIRVAQAGVQETGVDLLGFVNLAAGTMLSIAEIVNRETLEWTDEFRSNVAHLASMADLKKPSAEAKTEPLSSKI